MSNTWILPVPPPPPEHCRGLGVGLLPGPGGGVGGAFLISEVTLYEQRERSPYG